MKSCATKQAAIVAPATAAKSQAIMAGPTSFATPTDSHKFSAGAKPKRRKKRFKREIVTDWTLLNAGDTVKIKQGSGSYFVNAAGDRSYLNSGGVVVVVQKEVNGFYARYTQVRKDCGEFFVYMGKTCTSPVSNSIVRRRHKLIKITDRLREKSN